MLEIGQALVVPAWIGHTATIPWCKRIDSASEVCPGEVDHVNCRVVWSPCDAAVLDLSLIRTLIDVRLRHIDGKCDIIDANVRPGDVLCETLASYPGLEASCIDGVDSSHVVKADIRDIGKLPLVLPEGPYAHAVGLIANDTAGEKDVMRAGPNSYGIIPIVDYTITNGNVCARNIEAIGIEGEATGGRVGINNTIADTYVGARKLDIPSNGLSRLERLH